jgi:hypothetical protein
VIAVASLISDSPSTTTTTRRGTPSRPAIAVAATGSVGETIAPRMKAASHEKAGIAVCTHTATAPHVASTRPTESREIGCTFCRRSRSEAKNAAE